MFVILDNVVHTHPEPTELSHYEWFCQEGWPSDTIETQVRGYYRAENDTFHAYLGTDFKTAPEIVRKVIIHLPVLQEKLGLKPTTLITTGAVYQRDVVEWPPRRRHGTLAQLLKAREVMVL
jgi:hypothetical protein